MDRSEGFAEPSGDILLSCSGGASGVTNISLNYTVPITNRLTSSGAPDIVLTIDSGAGPAPTGVVPAFLSPNNVVFNGVPFTVPASGSFAIHISNVRLAANLAAPGQSVNVSFATSNLSLTNASVTVATPGTGLLATYASNGITCVGSPLPSTINLTNLFTAGTIFASTRVTEGFASAFLPKDPTSDAGTRILVSYSNFPSGARVFLPDFVAGNDAVQPTAGGDLGAPQSGGIYSPSASGSLLLARVIGADATGRGGAPTSTAAVIPPNTVFNSATEVALSNGAGTAVYEVIDANPSAQENAQFPTFIGVPTGQNPNATVANESLSFAPVNTISTAMLGLPVPRFASIPPPNDCQAVGDCGASYFPVLSVSAPNPLQFSSSAGGTVQTQYVQVNNTSGGLLYFTFSVAYQGTGGWLTVVNQSGSTNHTTLRLDANPGSLAPGTYQATLTIDAGAAGVETLPITFITGPPRVTILSVLNAASFQSGPLVAGSLATIKGKNFNGKVITVTFGGIAATILYNDAQQINVQVPASLASNTAAQLVVTVDGNSSTAQSVPLASVAPGIFGVLNQDNTVNSATNPAPSGSIIQIFATGLLSPTSPGPVITGFANQGIPTVYSGSAPDGVQQVNAQLPTGIASGSAALVVCGTATNAQEVCSPSATLYVK